MLLDTVGIAKIAIFPTNICMSCVHLIRMLAPGNIAKHQVSEEALQQAAEAAKSASAMELSKIQLL